MRGNASTAIYNLMRLLNLLDIVETERYWDFDSMARRIKVKMRGDR